MFVSIGVLLLAMVGLSLVNRVLFWANCRYTPSRLVFSMRIDYVCVFMNVLRCDEVWVGYYSISGGPSDMSAKSPIATFSGLLGFRIAIIAILAVKWFSVLWNSCVLVAVGRKATVLVRWLWALGGSWPTVGFPLKGWVRLALLVLGWWGW